ncbi:hypothetical protein EVAR_4611_1 [Eumeta japonica]|uniref:Uncharacterized protein n=1 Tax=Eumeta variegata TaxID=151549 RepID=A0A4C1SX28_EUMVA|nr:hypothetical protein EVAR_4611_1 [Eumeta japonica]
MDYDRWRDYRPYKGPNFYLIYGTLKRLLFLEKKNVSLKNKAVVRYEKYIGVNFGTRRAYSVGLGLSIVDDSESPRTEGLA